MTAAPIVPPGRPEGVRRRRRSALLALALAAPAVGGVLASGGTAAASPVLVPPQLSVIAGTGTAGVPVPGPASASPLKEPEGVAVDAAGDVYVADYQANVVEKVTPAGVLSVVAGNGTSGAEVPGPATSSPLHGPYKVAVSASGDLYIADYSNYVVEKVTPGGTLSVVAGTGTQAAAVPGAATGSPLGGAESLALDAAGNLFIGDDTNHAVEKVTPAGQLSVVAGIQGTRAAPTPGPATSSALSYPEGVGVDAAGNLYIADGGNRLVEKVTPTGTLSVVAGIQGSEVAPTPGPASSSSVGYPEDLAVAADGTFYVADDENEVVERVTPTGYLSVYAGIVGNYQAPVAGAATLSPVGDPNGVAVAADGSLYIADDENEMVEKVRPAQTLAVSLSVAPGRAAAGQKVLFSGRVTLGGMPAARAPITVTALDANGDRYTVARNVTRADGSFSGYAASPYDATLTATSGPASASARFTVRVGIADQASLTGHTVIVRGATVPGYRGDAHAVSTALVTVDSRGRFLRVLEHGRLQPYRTVSGLPFGANPFVIGAVLRPGTYRIAVAVAGTSVDDPSYGPATVVTVR